MHHAAVDGCSAFHFLHTWSALSRDDGAAVELIPCHDRTLLRPRPRSPPSVVHPDTLSVLFPKVTFSEPSGPTAAEVFTISKDQVAVLKRRCGGASTFCAVSALVWQCACVARRLPPGTRARLIFLADLRRRRKLRPTLPDRYFGNAAVSVGVARDMDQASLESIAGCIAGAMDDQLVRSAMDHLELTDMDSSSSPLPRSMPETDLRITSWLGLPVYDVDFGWGKPQTMSRAVAPSAGYVFLMNDAEGTVRMLVCMEAANINNFERLFYASIQEEN